MIEKRPDSGYGLLRQRQFQQLWFANLTSGLGMVMLVLACSWVMATKTTSPLLVAAVPMALSIPAFVLGIPAGFMSDVIGHRRLLLAAQAWMLPIEVAFALIAWRAHMTPVLLLAMLTLVGIGVVAQESAWKPLLNELYPDQMVSVMSLNSLSSKFGRVAGPALGGYLTGLAGVVVVLAARVCGHVMMIVALRRVPRCGADAVSRKERPRLELRESVHDGWTVLTRSPGIYGPMIRCAAFMIPCAGMLALLPLDAKDNIQTDVIGYGGLLAILGLGSVSGASLMPWLQRRYPINSLATLALAVFSAGILGISRWDSMFLDAFFLLVVGFVWSIVSVSYQVSAQAASPNAVRGLMMSFYGVTLQGSAVAGSFIFGLLAEVMGVSSAILLGGCVAMGGLLLVRRFPLAASADTSERPGG